MTLEDLERVKAEIDRFSNRLNRLIDCTKSAQASKVKIWENKKHTDKYGYDEGVKGWRSKSRASVKRGALDLREELLKVTK